MAATRLSPLSTATFSLSLSSTAFRNPSSGSQLIRSSFHGRTFPRQKLNPSSFIQKDVTANPVRRIFAEVFNIELEHNGEIRKIQVPGDETILSVALDEGMDLPHDCKLGVCMTCPAKIEAGTIDQSDGMLSDDVQEKGYALLCASYPRSDCKVRIIPEEELLSLQLATAND